MSNYVNANTGVDHVAINIDRLRGHYLQQQREREEKMRYFKLGILAGSVVGLIFLISLL
jgi:hypothetical protein